MTTFMEAESPDVDEALEELGSDDYTAEEIQTSCASSSCRKWQTNILMITSNVTNARDQQD